MPKPKPVLLDVDGIEVKLSNPDKIYFPELGEHGGRKADLVEYYRSVALAGRLLAARVLAPADELELFEHDLHAAALLA